MFEVVVGTRSQLGPALFTALARYRYEVFIKGQGWRLPCAQGLELDAFDCDETVHVLACNARREIVGCARLIPTDRPFLLGEVFAHLMGQTPLPCSGSVWELSRFSSWQVQGARHRQSWQGTTAFMSRVLDVACALGARRLIAFSAPGNERLLKRMGVVTQRIAPAQQVDGFCVAPFWIEVADTGSVADRRGLAWRTG